MTTSWSFVVVLVHVCQIAAGWPAVIAIVYFANNETVSSSDHRSILTSGTSCNSSQYTCNDGTQCVNEWVVCDGEQDCNDGSDEGGKCDGCQHGNGGCHQLCKNTASGPKCHCAKGYHLSTDGTLCEEVDECMDGGGPCQHYCHNTDGSYRCSCAHGYTLQGDGETCKLDQYQSGLLYFSVGHQVLNLPLNSWSHLPPSRYPETGLMCDVRIGTVEGLDTNNLNSHYFYTRNSGIYANNEAEICLVQGLSQFGTNMAIDWVTGNLYFVNEEPAQLGLCRSDGRFCSLLLKSDDLDFPRGLVVHPKFGLMFWTDLGGRPKIERANMDGSDRGVIVVERLSWPNAIAIDYVHDFLYFTDSKHNVIERCRLDGSHRDVIRTVKSHPFDMIVFDEHIYWTDWEINGVVTANVANASDHRYLYRDSSTQPYGIALFHLAYQQKDLPNPCHSISCSHMCALTSSQNAAGEVDGSCLCPSGYEFRPGDKKECIPIHDEPQLSGPRWCLDAFVSACESENPCEHGGKCILLHNDYGTPVAGSCLCQPHFAGEFCEVYTPPETSAVLEKGADKPRSAWVVVSFILSTFVWISSTKID